MPTEAQWEYACKAGTVTPFCFGETISTDQVNYHGDYGDGRLAYCQRQNQASFCDMKFPLYKSS